MARFRRRRGRFTSAGRARSGRRLFWWRDGPFSITPRETSSGTHSDIILSESDWQDPVNNLNEQARGGARLERLIIDYGLSLEATTNFWETAAQANIAIIPEFMMWKQSDQFLSAVLDSNTFDQVRESSRVIMDEVPVMSEDSFNANDAPDGTGDFYQIRSVRGHYETKTKVRLGDGALGIAWRGLFDEGAASLLGFTDWVRVTFLVSTP